MEKIIERVQKLLALAGNNPNENEAAAAIAKAHAILAEHNLSMMTVQQHRAKSSDGDEERGAMPTDTNFSEKYYGWLWGEVARLHYCTCFQQRPNPHKRQTFYTVVGRKVNAIVATQLAMYLCQTIRRLANEEAKRRGRNDHAFKNAFLMGAASRLHARLNAMRFGDTNQQNALVLWSGDEEAKNREFIENSLGIKDLAVSKSRPSKVNPTGYAAGLAAADKVSLAQQIHNSSTEVKAIK